MHRTLLVVSCLVTGGMIAAANAQEGVLAGDPARGAAVLAEARQAIGGDKLVAVKALQLKGSFRRAAGNNQVEGDLEITLQLPDKMKRVEDTSAPGGGPAILNTQVLNGAEVWDENTGRGGGFGGGFGGFGGRGGFGGGRGGRGGGQPGAGGANPQDGQGAAAAGRGVDPERLRQALLRQRQADFERLTVGLLLTTSSPVAWVGTAESPDGKADVVEVKPADGVPMRLFVDQATHMPLMLTWQGAAPPAGGGRGGGRRGQPGGGQGGQAPVAPGLQQAPAPGPGVVQGGDAAAAGPRRGGGAPATLQMTFADYKAVNGVKLPHTITRGVNGQTNEEWAVSGYKVNPSIKADFFTQK